MHVLQKYVYILQEPGKLYTVVDRANQKARLREDQNFLNHGHLSFPLYCELPEESETH